MAQGGTLNRGQILAWDAPMTNIRSGWHGEILPMVSEGCNERQHWDTHHGTETGSGCQSNRGPELRRHSNPKVRLYKEAPEKVQHSTAGCKMLVPKAYMECHNQVAGKMYRKKCAEFWMDAPRSTWETKDDGEWERKDPAGLSDTDQWDGQLTGHCSGGQGTMANQKETWERKNTS